MVFPWSMWAMIEKLRVREVGMVTADRTRRAEESTKYAEITEKERAGSHAEVGEGTGTLVGEGSVTGRYEIQEILTQDASGVVFHAEDRDSGKAVVLRRFFPYGPDGGGLQEAERSAYLVALQRLREVRHPTLRAVLGGGCDPVDGMPFLVTEWVEGRRLSELLKERALSPASTKALLVHALEASTAVSAAFGEEAVWVETSPESIILPEDGETLTFWACPLKWLGSPEKRGGLLPLAKLAEKALHWRGKPVAGTAEGLGSWIKAVRENPERWTISEAITALKEPLTIKSGPGRMDGVPTVPMPAAKKRVAGNPSRKRAVVPVLLALLLGAAAAAGGFYFLKSRLNRSAAAPAGEGTEIEIPKGSSALEFGMSSQAARGNAVVTGRVAATEEGAGNGIRYLKITVEGAAEPRWVACQAGPQATGMQAADFEALKNKRVRVSGEEKKEDSHRRSVIHIRSLDQIEVLD